MAPTFLRYCILYNEVVKGVEINYLQFSDPFMCIIYSSKVSRYVKFVIHILEISLCL